MTAGQNSGLTERTSRGIRAVLQTVVLSTLLAVIKTTAGLIGNSYALVADGIESMLDILSSLVVWGGIRIAARPPDKSHPYGHGKAESMAAMAVALVLLSAAVGIAVQSVRQIVTPTVAPASFTLVVLVLVVAVKELIYRRLIRVGKAISSTSLETDAWHHRSDALTSAAAFIGISIALIGGEGYESADAWAALVACGIIGVNGVRLLRNAVAEVMDTAAPEEIDREIRSSAESVPGVAAVEKCFARKSGPGWLVDLHVEVEGQLSVSQGHEIGHRVKDVLCASDLGVLHVLVHVEPAGSGESSVSEGEAEQRD
jgi:cation diffusion facilitator family transporter